MNDSGSVLEGAIRGHGWFCIDSSFCFGKNINEIGLIPLLTNYKLASQEDAIYALYPHRNQSSLVKLFIEEVKKLSVLPLYGSPA